MLSYVTQGGQPQTPDQMLIDDAATALVHELGACLTEMEVKSNYFGRFSLTVILYDRDKERLDKVRRRSFQVFVTIDATLYEERYNLLNVFGGSYLKVGIEPWRVGCKAVSTACSITSRTI